MLVRGVSSSAVVLGVVMLSIVSGCSTDSSAGSATSDVRAVLDEATGSITLPYDAYTTTPIDDQLLTSARSAAVAVCAREQGVGAMAIAHVPQEAYLSESFFGPWTAAQAEKFAFVAPAPDADLRANGVLAEGKGEASALNGAEVGANYEALSMEDHAVIEECGSTPDSDAFVPGGSGPWGLEILESTGDPRMDAPKDDAVRGIFDELYTCYEENGMMPPTSELGIVPGMPEGANFGVIDEEQISLAIASVQCKEETGFTQKLADTWAQQQAAVMADYADELAVQKAELDEVLAAAETYIADHAEVFEPVAG